MILKNLVKVLLIFIFTMQAISATELERRKITPPKLSNQHISKQIICYRPMRQGMPAMNIYTSDDKIIVNNYGHGGSGWTLAPGAASYVVQNLKATYNKEVNKHTPITIMGAGVLGLFSALELVNHGFKNITIVAEAFEDLTSHHAGGLLAPVSMDNAPEMQKLIDEIGFNAYKFYRQVAMKKNKQLKTGAYIVSSYFGNRESSGLEPYVGKVMQPAKDVTVDFQNGTTHQMVVYDDGIFMDTHGLMQALKEVLEKSHVKFVHKKISNFAEIDTKVIFNCTGLGAKELVHDDKMISVQGHLMMLKDQDPQTINYMMAMDLGSSKTAHNQNIERAFYIMPKRALNAQANEIGVIGGTFIENATPETPNTEEFAMVLNAAKKFYGLPTDPQIATIEESSKAA